MQGSDDSFRPLSDLDPVAAVGLEAVVLSYHYLNAGDIDAYGSLLAAEAILHRPGDDSVCGRGRIEEHWAHRVGADAGYRQVDSVRIVCGSGSGVGAADGSGTQVIATGRLTRRGEVEIEFVDLHTVSRDGLLLSQKSYFFVDPQAPGSAGDGTPARL